MKVPRTDFYFIIILSVSLLSYQYRTDGFFMEDAPFCFPISLPTSLLLGSEGVKQTVLCILLIAQRERAKESC